MTEKDLYKTHFTNITPQRGFLTSQQSLITIVDVDITYENHFILNKIKEDTLDYFFTKNGPIRICPYQKNFSLESDNFDDLKFFNIYQIQNFTEKSSFIKKTYKYSKAPFEKEIKNNKIIFKINESTSKFLEKKVKLYLGRTAEEINPIYSPKIYIDHSTSIKIYHTDGYDKILSYIEEVFFQLKLSGKLYKTKNGLRIILNDKFRNLNAKKGREDALKIMGNLLMDKTFLSMYENPEHARLNSYLARLTPKLKNYKIFNENLYEEVCKNLDSLNLQVINFEKDVKPIKYDLNTVTYKNNKNNVHIDQSFDMLKTLISLYLKDNSFAVCSLIKSYDYGGEDKIINKFIKYHDIWTKSHVKDTILI